MIFFSIILIIGALTTFTDLKSKKIYNQHLAIGAILCLITTTYVAVFKHEQVAFHIVNGLVAFLIGVLLHRSGLWKGGDAKLFALYAFLMPLPTYHQTLFPSVVNLFASSFLIGMVILIPVFIKDIIINHKAIVNDLVSHAKRQAMFNAVGTVIFSSWILFPFYCLAKIKDPVIIFTISYFFFNWGYDLRGTKKNHTVKKFKKMSVESSIGLIFGFLARLWLCPNSLSYPALTKYIIIIALFATLSACIHTMFNHLKNYQERFSFAPLLFMGCVLSYTPFLAWVMHLITR